MTTELNVTTNEGRDRPDRDDRPDRNELLREAAERIAGPVALAEISVGERERRRAILDSPVRAGGRGGCR